MTSMNEEENKIIQSAIIFAKKERKDIANKLTNTTIFVPDTIPISVFMAGSPGAGKTEFSKNFLSLILFFNFQISKNVVI